MPVWSPNQQKSGLAFQLSNGDEVKKTGMVVRTTWDHVGQVLALSKCSIEENFAITVFTPLFGKENKQQKVGDFCFQPR